MTFCSGSGLINAGGNMKNSQSGSLIRQAGVAGHTAALPLAQQDWMNSATSCKATQASWPSGSSGA